MASLQVSYDPDRISYDDVVREMTRLHGARPGATDELELRKPPLLRADPLFRSVDRGLRQRLPRQGRRQGRWIRSSLCELNGLSGRAELKRVHSGTEYWVAALGFWPGLCSLMPLDPRHRLIAPKYNPPRTWTPKGTIGHRRRASPASIRTRRRAATRSSPARRCRSGTASSGSPPSRTAWRCSAPATASASSRSTARNGTRSTPR